MPIQVFHRATDPRAAEIVLLHAFPFSSTMWGPMLPHLSKNVTVAACDAPGFGASETRQWTMARAAAELSAELPRAGIQHPILLGLSMGGYLAMAFHRAYPKEVRAMILADTKAEADTPDAKADRENYAQAVLKGGAAVTVERQLGKMVSDWTKQHSPATVETVRSWMLEADPEAIANALRAMAAREDSADLLASLEFPVLLIAGEEDSITPASGMLKMQEGIPEADFVTIKHAGHLSAVEQPEVFAKAVNDFIRYRVHTREFA